MAEKYIKKALHRGEGTEKVTLFQIQFKKAIKGK
jgi:hypothetical protein